MKTKLFALLLVCTLMSFTSVQKSTSTPAAEKTLNKFIVHSGHFVSIGSDSKYYYVTFTFNMATQSFGAFHVHEDAPFPDPDVIGTYVSGTGDTTSGDGSTVDITTLIFTIYSGTVALGYNGTITFDY